MMRVLLVLVLVASIFYIARSNGDRRADLPAPVSVEALLLEPGRWDGKAVSLQAQVLDRASIMGLGGFRVVSRTSDPILVLGSRSVPPAGETVTVEGTFWMAATIGNAQFPVIFAR